MAWCQTPFRSEHPPLAMPAANSPSPIARRSRALPSDAFTWDMAPAKRSADGGFAAFAQKYHFSRITLTFSAAEFEAGFCSAHFHAAFAAHGALAALAVGLLLASDPMLQLSATASFSSASSLTHAACGSVLVLLIVRMCVYIVPSHFNKAPGYRLYHLLHCLLLLALVATKLVLALGLAASTTPPTPEPLISQEASSASASTAGDGGAKMTEAPLAATAAPALLLYLLAPIYCHLVPTSAGPRVLLLLAALVCAYREGPGGDVGLPLASTPPPPPGPIADLSLVALLSLLSLLCGVAIGHGLEWQARWLYACREEMASTANHSRRADSRLNHVLKNKSAEARFLVEEVADGLKTIKQAVQQGQPDKVGAPTLAPPDQPVPAPAQYPEAVW